MKIWHHYLESWKSWKKILLGFGVDCATFSGIFLLMFVYTKLVEARTYALTGGNSIEEIKLALLTGSIESNQAFLANVKLLAFIFILGSIIVTIVALLAYTFSRSFLWNKLTNQPFSFKKYWRWNGIVLAVGVIGLLYFSVVVILRLLVNFMFPLTSDIAYVIVNGLFISFFFYLFLLFIFAAFYSFTKHYKVWSSLSNAFTILSHKNTCLAFLFILATGLLTSILISYLQKWLFFQPPLLVSALSITLFFLLFAWARVFFLSIHEPRKPHSQ